MSVKFTLNQKEVNVDASSQTPLLYVLRNDLNTNASKFGCGQGQCGACSVLVDGESARSCVLPLSAIEGKSITTLEGLGDRNHPHPVQQGFIDEQAMQCGYCANGMMMAAVALLEKNSNPDDKAIKQALDKHICRCGTHTRIIKAVKRASILMQADKS